MRPEIRIFTRSAPKTDLGSFAIDGADASVIVTDSPGYEPCDIALLYGVGGEAENDENRLRHDVVRRHRGALIALETGFIGRQFPPRRFAGLKSTLGLFQRTNSSSPYMRVGIGGVFGDDADFCNHGSPPDRWRAFQAQFGLRIQPYRVSGDHVLLVGQVPGDSSLRGTSMVEWIRDTAGRIRFATDRPIVIRLHPRTHRDDAAAIKRGLSGLRNLRFADQVRPVWRDLEKAWACVTFSSSTAVEALLAGIPPICLSPASIAYRICSKRLEDLDNPLQPARTQWLCDLAYAQWTEAEMASGAVWRHIRDSVLRNADQRAGSPAGRKAYS